MTSPITSAADSGRKKKWSQPLKSLGAYLGKKRENRRVRNTHSSVVSGASVSNHEAAGADDGTHQGGDDSSGRLQPPSQDCPESPGRRQNQPFLGRIRNAQGQTSFRFNRERPPPPTTTPTSSSGPAAVSPRSPSMMTSPGHRNATATRDEMTPTAQNRGQQQPQRPSLLRPPSSSSLMPDSSPKRQRPTTSSLPFQTQSPPRSPRIVTKDGRAIDGVSESSSPNRGSTRSIKSDFWGDQILPEELPFRPGKTAPEYDVSEATSPGNMIGPHEHNKTGPSHATTRMVLVDDQHRSFASLNGGNMPSRPSSFSSRKTIGGSSHASSQMTIKMGNISEEYGDDDDHDDHGAFRNNEVRDAAVDIISPHATMPGNNSNNMLLPRAPNPSPSCNNMTHEDFLRIAPERTTSDGSTSSTRKSRDRSRKESRSRSRSKERTKRSHLRQHHHHHHHHHHPDVQSSSAVKESSQTYSNIPSTYDVAPDTPTSPRERSPKVTWKDTIAMHQGIPVGLPMMGREQSFSKRHESKSRIRGTGDDENEPRGRNDSRSRSKSRSRSPPKRRHTHRETRRSNSDHHSKEAGSNEARSPVTRSKSDELARIASHDKSPVITGRLGHGSTDRLLYTSPKLVQSTYKSPLEGSFQHQALPTVQTMK
jgi:hypothetical protein